MASVRPDRTGQETSHLCSVQKVVSNLTTSFFVECVSQILFHVDYSWRLETVKSVKSLGLNISSDLKWNVHVSELVRKVSTRLYFLRRLKKSHVAIRELLLFYITCMHAFWSTEAHFFVAICQAIYTKTQKDCKNAL